MAYVVIARWLAREGEQDAVAAALANLALAALAEPGVISWDVERDPYEPRHFVLREVYVDEAAFDSHLASDHVKRYGLDDALPRLESRSREVLEP